MLPNLTGRLNLDTNIQQPAAQIGHVCDHHLLIWGRADHVSWSNDVRNAAQFHHCGLQKMKVLHLGFVGNVGVIVIVHRIDGYEIVDPLLPTGRRLAVVVVEICWVDLFLLWAS